MRNLMTIAVLSGLLTLGGCATMPTGPSVMVLPGKGERFKAFQHDDLLCRQFALDAVGGKSAQKTANESTAKSAGVGALLGAAVGAAAGHSRGAGIGAATGALMGTSIGSSNGYGDAYGVQRRYNIAYEQCMYSKGNRIPVPAVAKGYSSSSRNYPPPPPSGEQSEPPTPAPN